MADLRVSAQRKSSEVWLGTSGWDAEKRGFFVENQLKKARIRALRARPPPIGLEAGGGSFN